MGLKSVCNVVRIGTALFVGAMTLGPNQAKAGERPFKATIEALAVGDDQSGVYDSSGKAAHLGRITEYGTYQFIGSAGPGLFYLEGEGTQVAANGDTLSFTFDEIVDFTTVPFTAAGCFTVTGGTGRFEGATGGGTFDTIGLPLDEGLGLSIEYKGTIDY